jgi:hypothetical protein
MGDIYRVKLVPIEICKRILDRIAANRYPAVIILIADGISTYKFL